MKTVEDYYANGKMFSDSQLDTYKFRNIEKSARKYKIKNIWVYLHSLIQTLKE